MGKRSVAGRVFVAAVLALVFWAFVTGAFGDFMRNPAPYFGVTGEETSDDVLFDDPSHAESDTDAVHVTDSVSTNNNITTDFPEKTDSDRPAWKTFEYALTPEYFNALLEKYAGHLPLRNAAARFADGRVILSGEIEVASFAAMMKIPSAFVIFLPDVLACTLECGVAVREGAVEVRVLSASAGSDLLAPYLSRPEILSEVERFLNRQLTEYLPDTYVMRSVSVTERGLLVRYEVRE